jgi:hypothetical protein
MHGGLPKLDAGRPDHRVPNTGKKQRCAVARLGDPPAPRYRRPLAFGAPGFFGPMPSRSVVRTRNHDGAPGLQLHALLRQQFLQS